MSTAARAGKLSARNSHALTFPEIGLKGKRVGMVLFSYYPNDPRPRRCAEALTQCGMQVDLICLQEAKEEPKHQVVNGVNVRRVPIQRQREGILRYVYQYSAFLLAASVILAFRMLKRRYDLVYVHNMPDFLVFSGLLPKLFGAKVVLDLHDPVPELMRTIFEVPEQAPVIRLLKWIENWSLWFADSIVTINQQCAEVFISRSCPREKVTVVMNSPDESIFRFHAPRAKQEGKERFVIMYHGTIVERNGLDLAVDAFGRIVPSIPQAELRIYGGRNPYLEGVLEQVRKLGIEKSVRYLGPKPLEQIVEAIEECDLGIIPNKRNIFTELNTPTRIFEYLALGKPVIAPRAPGITDYFNDESIFFFELGNAEDLARQMESVFRSSQRAREVTLRGQEVHQEHTWREERSILTQSVANTLRV